MATGGPCIRCYAALAVVVVVVLAATRVWNPFPGIWSWINQSEPLAAGSAWQQRLGGATTSVTVTGGAVVVEHRTRIEGYGLAAGVKLWEKNADWSAVAGGDDDSVVVVGELLTRGYQVLDPVSGLPRRTDTEAVAVWTYADAILDVRCAKPRDCVLSSWPPRASQPSWTVGMPGIGRVLFADNPDLPGPRPLRAARIDDDGPRPAPALLGFPADGKLSVVDTAIGRVVQVVEPDRGRRAVVIGGRLLTVVAEARDGACYFTVSAAEAGTGQRIWRRDGLNLRTAGGGAGCRQDRDPAGGLDVVLGVDPVGREVVVDAHDGRQLWRGAAGQRALAVDDRFALVRGADGRALSARSFAAGRVAWRRAVDPKAQAALTPSAAVVVDAEPRRVIALDRASGATLVEARTDARVLAVGTAGLIIGAGRDMAYLPFAVDAR